MTAMDANDRILLLPKGEQITTTAQTMDASTLQERIVQSSATVTTWAAAHLVRDVKPDIPIPIGELFADYEGFCRDEGWPTLSRKVWMGAMKLAGFHTDSGAFANLTLIRDNSRKLCAMP